MTVATETLEKPKSDGLSITSLEAAIEALVDIAHEASSLSSFYRRSLPIVASCLRLTFIDVELRNAGMIVQEQFSRSSIAPEFWSEITQEAMAEALAEPGTRMRVFLGRDIDASVALVTAPIGNMGRHGGVLAAILPFTRSAELQGLLEKVDILCTLTSSLADSVGNASEVVPDEAHDELSRTRKVASFRSEVELAYAITNKLRTREGYVQVALASVTSNELELLSVSGLDDIAHRSPGIKNIRIAMQECVDLGRPVVDQDGGLEEEGIATGGRLHHQWRVAIGDASVASLPLRSGDEVVAVLSLQRSQKQPFSAEELEGIQEQVEPYAAGLEMVRIARRSLLTHFRQAALCTGKSFVSRGQWGRKVLLATSLVLGIWAIWGSIPYSINAPAALVSMAGRHVASATDGVLDRVHVKPGDRVAAGQLLCEFDTSELDLEAAKLRGQVAAHEVDLYRALAEGSATEAELARVSGEAVQANLDLVLHRIASARVTAPVAGLVLEGDHHNRIGDAFAKGETLFRIAESEQWKLEISVPERDIDLLQIGSEGDFASHSRPGARHPLMVQRLSPTASTDEGRNVFIVEASCEIPHDWIRSGMEGYVSIEVGDRAPAWVAGHRLMDFLRMNLWL